MYSVSCYDSLNFHPLKSIFYALEKILLTFLCNSISLGMTLKLKSLRCKGLTIAKMVSFYSQVFRKQIKPRVGVVNTLVGSEHSTLSRLGKEPLNLATASFCSHKLCNCKVWLPNLAIARFS